MSEIELTNYEAMLTEDVLRKVRPYGVQLSKRVHGALSADDIVQSAIVMMLRREKRPPVYDMEGFLQWRMQLVVFDWTNGWKNKGETLLPLSTQRERYLATCEIPNEKDEVDPSKIEELRPLQMPDPSPSWELLLDVERALRVLTTEQQRLVRFVFWEGLTYVETGQRMGISAGAVYARLEHITLRLKKALKDYETPERDGKRWTDSFEAVPL